MAEVLSYSTEEKVVGTWIDGKPIYRKVFVTTVPATNNWRYGVLTNTEIDKLIKVCGSLFADNGYNVTVDSAGIDRNTGVVDVMTTYTGSTGTLYLALEYTKKTD